MKKMFIICILFALLALPLFAQGVSETEALSAPAEEPVDILISAAASLTDCMNELKGMYTDDHPNVTITSNYGSSGSLQQQIEQGAPADIFFSAGKRQMNALQEKGLMKDDTVRDILENKVVLITPKNGLELTSLQDLTRSDVTRIAVGEPGSVPVGQYTAQAFENLGLTNSLQNKLIFAKDVREVLSWVETGNADAGLVYETDAKISPDVVIRCSAPEGSHDKVIYPVGVVKDSSHPEVAEDFVNFFFTPEAVEVFAKYGFTVI